MPSLSKRRHPINILCFHGLTENAQIMQSKLTSVIERLSPDDFQFVFMSAPFILPDVASMPTLKGAMKLRQNGVIQDERILKQGRDLSKACLATSYLVAIRAYKLAEEKRIDSKQVEKINEMEEKYTVMLESVDEETRRAAVNLLADTSISSKRWWTLPDDFKKVTAYVGQEVGFAHISKVMREQGPFDGVITFSTGSMMAIYCQALLQGCVPRNSEPTFQPPANQEPFQFAIHSAPWMTTTKQYGPHFDALLRNIDAHTPALCFEGVRDIHCIKGSSSTFAKCINAERFEYHNGGHSIPCWEDYPAFMADWLSLAAKECRGLMGKEEARAARLQLVSPFKESKMRQDGARL